jgi:hypothetical protein
MRTAKNLAGFRSNATAYTIDRYGNSVIDFEMTIALQQQPHRWVRSIDSSAAATAQ